MIKMETKGKINWKFLSVFKAKNTFEKENII